MSPSTTSARRPLLAVAAMPVVPVTNGYSLRVSNIVRELAANWQITLIAPLGGATVADVAQLGVHRVVPMPLFGQWNVVFDEDARRRIRAIVDGVVDEDAPVATLVWAGAEVVLDNPRVPPAAIDRLDCEVVIAWRELRHARGLKDRLRAARDAMVWARQERRLVRSAAATIVDGVADARTLRAVSGRAVHIVQNGVEIQPMATAADEAPTPTVVFTGTMSYSANVQGAEWFVASVWPSVRSAVPAARLILAGRAPSPQVRALAAAPGVEVLADVPEMSSVLRSAWVAIAPVSTGSGIRTKVLEAWSVGRACVLSPVAASGMRLDATAAGLVAGDALLTADLVVRLLSDPAERQRAGAAAHALATREYGGWGPTGRHVSDILSGIAAK